MTVEHQHSSGVPLSHVYSHAVVSVQPLLTTTESMKCHCYKFMLQIAWDDNKVAGEYLCAVAFWQPADERVCIGSLSSLLYLFLSSLWVAIADVLPDSAGEEHRLLAD